VSNYVDCLASCGCISLINKPTRFSKNSKPSLLDHIYTNICDEKRIINSGITVFDISDHLPIFVNFNLHHPTHQNSKPKFRCRKHFDPTIFVSDLSLKLINLNPETDDVNTLSDEFVKIFNDILDTHAPCHYASRKEQHSFNKAWLTKGILTSIAKNNTLYRKQLTTNNPNIIRKYNTYRNKLTHLKQISKQNYHKQAFQKCHHDIKKTWKLVNEIIAIKNKSQQKNRLFEDSECQKQCEDLNNFFSEVGKSLSTKIKPSPTTYRHFIKHINSKNSLFLALTDAYEIQLLIKNLKMKSNSSPNDIPSKF